MQTYKLPTSLEEIILAHVKKVFYPSTRRSVFQDRPWEAGDTAFFAGGVEKLHKAFTSERGELPTNYLNQKEFRAAYLLYFLPANLLKVTALLGEIDEGFFDKPSLNILDVGCGPGTGVLGLLAFLNCHGEAVSPSPSPLPQGERKRERGDGSRNDVEVTLVDQNKPVLNDAAALIRAYAKKIPNVSVDIKNIPADLMRFFGRSSLRMINTFDLIIASNIMNELPENRRIKIVRSLVESLAPNGILLIVEPALRFITRELMELRDQIIDSGLGYIRAPCLHQLLCPMLKENRRDWCHTYIEWERPRIVEELDRRLGNRKDYLKCSYLVVQKMEPGTKKRSQAPFSAPRWRIVSSVMHSKGKVEVVLCGEGRLKRITRFDKDKSPSNFWWDQIWRGDILATHS